MWDMSEASVCNVAAIVGGTEILDLVVEATLINRLKRHEKDERIERLQNAFRNS